MVVWVRISSSLFLFSLLLILSKTQLFFLPVPRCSLNYQLSLSFFHSLTYSFQPGVCLHFAYTRLCRRSNTCSNTLLNARYVAQNCFNYPLSDLFVVILVFAFKQHSGTC